MGTTYRRGIFSTGDVSNFADQPYFLCFPCGRSEVRASSPGLFKRVRRARFRFEIIFRSTQKSGAAVGTHAQKKGLNGRLDELLGAIVSGSFDVEKYRHLDTHFG